MASSEGRRGPRKSRREIGAGYEQLAAKYFRDQGYQILEQNWQAGHREIDLIVRKNDLVAFVEVKASSTESFGHPVERVDKTKVRRLVSAAQEYLMTKNIEKVDFRFDVITFVAGRLEHFPGAFEGEQ